MSPTLFPWISLILAGLFEVAWALALKASHGFSKPMPTLLFAVTAAASMALLAYAMKHLPVGTAYAIWTGIGAVGTVILGIFWFGDPVNAMRIVSILLILAGIVGLKIA
ncbi:Quaternary ammonium compound-resistance protein SugE [Andreprevotia sp. IGB-42]|uniref:quaternary ammonium compound efflux SMR transporter SugE n=1 Tax=Andreprevotia sp. IGB-42 TaxID=2497473 RepID=UPI00135C2686|nr:multidrug efflux SMR transporter [Andreprevotia sp. IGB-42]KAF0814994.1 Quaternary ammonium compound-resistance protein SugE [Andreprevotia sp. IGB-42]